MRLLFVTPEITPFSRRTPTGDTCAALPKALRGRGHEVTVVSPLYGSIDPMARGLGRRLRKVVTEVDGAKTPLALYDARTAAGVELQFLGHEELFTPCDGAPVLESSADNARRFEAFARGVVSLIGSDDDGFDVVQCHDWATALVPTLLQRDGQDLPTVLSFGDVTQTGRFGSDIERELGLEHGFLEAGVRDATKLTTGSVRYAAEIGDASADGLAARLAARGRDLSGIVGGIDVSTWNPATDAYLETRFDPMDLSGKRRCKAALQREAGFPVRDDVPLIAVVGALRESSGLDVLARIVARALRNDVQLFVVPEGGADLHLADVLSEHAKRFSDRLFVDADPERGASHRALSAADLCLVPPRQPAGGSAQLRAQRYGALPIGPRSGSVADTVVDCDANLTTGTGFLFDVASDGPRDEEVLGAIQRGVAAFSDRRGFERARARVLDADHGWDRAAYLYERLYESIE